MNEEKLYAVRNEDGKYWDFNGNRNFGRVENNHSTAIASKKLATIISNLNGGHVVTFVQEPKKVVLSKEQAKIVEDAHDDKYPANYISGNSDEEKLLMEAFVNGYTVAKEKKYNVKVPHTEGWHFHKYSSASKSGDANGRKPFPANDNDTNLNKSLMLFTKAEIEHYGLQDCEKEEVTDDAD
ncbi:DUF1642 domain-containing protein [Lacticaseibacillus paracasei]|uniref:DUF1642 domain-containing protein n=1 Tax=Lacticaseibacillus paracasei TaxID=1597 RepID=UPI0022EC3BAB|nr:DUF1642 domain-containing protein [Lacticaseibacillus paracasei]WBS98123.1 DUF1642 domain-containing protein [Lacticaseibacillus paracasei]